MRILVVDDERKIRHVIKSYLAREGYAVGEADNGASALSAVRTGQWDLVVLDLMMPSTDGWEVLRQLRKDSTLPVIVLTARDDELDRVLGLELGADDYVVKPFSPRELVARVKAVLRRAGTGGPPEAGPVQRGVLTIDPVARQVLVRGRPVSLNRREFDLLLHMARSPKRVFRREDLLNQVWGFEFFGDTRAVDTSVNRLRTELKKVTDTEYVKTVWGLGYKFEDGDAGEA